MPYLDNAYPWEKAPMLRLLIPFATGIFLYDRYAAFMPPNGVLFCILCLGLTLLLWAGQYPSISNRWPYLLSLQVLLVLSGTVCTSLRDESRQHNWLWKTNSNSPFTMVRVAGASKNTARSLRFPIRIIGTLQHRTVTHCCGTAYLYVRKNSAAGLIEAGDTLILPNKWSPIQNAGNPFEADYVRFCRRKNVFFRQFVTHENLHVYGKATKSSLQKIHYYCLSVLNRYIRDSTALALMQAMLLGEEQDIEADTRQAYSDTGVIHIISISGAHVALLFAVVTFLLGKLKTTSARGLYYITGLSLIWLYVLLAGAAVPAVRAAVMFTIILLGNLMNRQATSLNQLCTAAFLMLLFEPAWLFSIGFQLSFAAVLSLILFYEPLLRLAKKVAQRGGFLIKSICASVAAEILVAPLVAYYFHSFPVMFIVANLLAGVAMGFILCLGLTLLVLAPVQSAGAFVALLITLTSRAFHYGIFALQQCTIPGLRTLYLSLPGLLLIYFVITFLSLFLKNNSKHAAWLSILSLMLFSMLVFYRNWENTQQEKLIAYNTYNKTTIEYIRSRHYHLLYGDEHEHTLNNAHMGWGATIPGGHLQWSWLTLGGHTIALHDSNAASRKPAEVLIIASYTDEPVTELLQIYRPQTVVLCGAQHKWGQLWRRACEKQHIRFHETMIDGAFILNARP